MQPRNYQSVFDKMREFDVVALWVCGDLHNNPDMVFFTGIHHVSDADLFLKIDAEPALFHRVTMESEEAAKSGLRSTPYFIDQPLSHYLEMSGGDLLMHMPPGSLKRWKAKG